MITYNWVMAPELQEDHVIRYANFYAQVFKEPPWNFKWHLKKPEDNDSPHSFIRMLKNHGAKFLDIRDESQFMIGLGVMIPSLTEASLDSDYADLRTYADANVGDAYIAGVAVCSQQRGKKIGFQLMKNMMDQLKKDQEDLRVILRTQESARQMVRLSEAFGMTVYNQYELTQAGVTLQRIVMTTR